MAMLRSNFSPSYVWVLGIELRSSIRHDDKSLYSLSYLTGPLCVLSTVPDQAPRKTPGLRAGWGAHHPGSWLFPLDRLGEVGETGNCTSFQTTSGQLPSQLLSLEVGAPELQNLYVEVGDPSAEMLLKG